MKAATGFRSVLGAAWLSGPLAALLLAGCAANRGGPEAATPTPDSVDVGYGAVGADQLVGSVGTVKGDDERAPRVRSLEEMLSRLPGVMVRRTEGGTLSVRVRGGSGSFKAEQDPLFVVDGVPLPSPSALDTLNPYDIASISVLTAAGETAIYGARGGNGVIVIKTKSGKR